MSHISFENEIFVAHFDYHNRQIPKDAGFWFHWEPNSGKCYKGCKACKAGLRKKWWTPFLEKAILLENYADTSALFEIAKYQKNLDASRSAGSITEYPHPDGYDYYPFQKAGIDYALEKEAVLWADDMGIGKTIQSLGVVNSDSSIKSVLVVCPASLRLNWLREAQRWLVGNWDYYVVETNSPIPESNFVITNYDRLKGDVLKSIMFREWDLLIVDEAHYVKNAGAQRTKNVLGKPIKWGKDDNGKWCEEEPRVPGLVDRARRKFFLTGTPILNRPIELFPLLHAIDPSQWRSRFKFARRYCGGEYTKYGFNDKGSSNEEELQLKLRSSCMIRRLKSEVLLELPPKRRQVIILPPNGAKGAIKEEQKAWKRHEKRLEELQDAVVFTKISEDKGAYEQAVKDLKEGFGVAFSEIAKARKKVALAKVPATVEHVNNMLESGINKIIVWAHHHEVLDKLQAKFGNIATQVDGRTPLRRRDEAVQAFQTVDELKIILCGIHAMGEGHTLTAAAHTVFVELDFTPAKMQQAEDRAHRIGQNESLLVQHLVFDETIDVSLAHMLVEKQAVIDAALDNKYEAIDVPLIPSPRKVYKKYSKEEREAITEAVRLLAGFCDGARQLDGAGFNRNDTKFGKQLAQRSYERKLTSGELSVAHKFTIKYRGQLPSDLLDVVQPTKK